MAVGVGGKYYETEHDFQREAFGWDHLDMPPTSPEKPASALESEGLGTPSSPVVETLTDALPAPVEPGQQYAGMERDAIRKQVQKEALKGQPPLKPNEDVYLHGDQWPDDWEHIHKIPGTEHFRIERSLETLSPKELRQRGYGKNG